MTEMPSLARKLSLCTALLTMLAPSASAQDRHWPPGPGQRRPPILRRPPIPRRPLIRPESTRVKVGIVDGVADTRVTMRFRNDGSAVGEKIVLFPLPRGASADEIQMEVGGRMEKGEVLDKNKARRIYESIVSRRRDPALLEYVGRGLLRLRVFPIPPRGTQTVQVRFRMVLPETTGLFGYEFPTRAVEGGSFALEVAIRSSKAIKNVYSPIAGFDVSRKDDYNARASFECRGRPKRDPVLFYGLSDRDFGLNLLTYRPKAHRHGDGPGYFLLMLAPKRDWKDEAELEKSIT
ncbi:MAG: VIT domain-containing protein, partial [Planctomycetota bacterium]